MRINGKSTRVSNQRAVDNRRHTTSHTHRATRTHILFLSLTHTHAYIRTQARTHKDKEINNTLEVVFYIGNACD